MTIENYHCQFCGIEYIYLISLNQVISLIHCDKMAWALPYIGWAFTIGLKLAEMFPSAAYTF